MALLKPRLERLEAATGSKGFVLFIVQPCHPDEQQRIRERGQLESRPVVETFTGVPRAEWSEPWAIEWVRRK